MDRIRESTTPMRRRPETYDLARDDFTPFDTPSSPFYETPALSDYSSRINRRIDFDGSNSRIYYTNATPTRNLRPSER